MSLKFRAGAYALVATGALALPGVASAADIQTAVSAVQTHTHRADAALNRAVSLFAKGNDSTARIAYAKSRKELGLAKAEAGKARRQASTPADQALAASAQALLGVDEGKNIDKLAAAVATADPVDASKIAAAAVADTKGRDKAIAVLTALLGQVPDQAKTGITTAIAALSQDRTPEVKVEADALIASNVPEKAKLRLTAAIKANIDGQVKASATLAALIASTDLPFDSKQGLQTAYDAVTADHASTADILSHLSDRMPANIRTMVAAIITQARTDAQSMSVNHPTGPPAGTPGGPPSGTPTGPPAGTPTGPPTK